LILALDCSTLTLSLALLRADGSVVEHRLVKPPIRQSEALPGEVDALLKAHGHSLADVTGFVCGLGPGSFTGLRIGLATAKGLAYALKKPIVGASSLAALARLLWSDKYAPCSPRSGGPRSRRRARAQRVLVAWDGVLLRAGPIGRPRRSR
jgi:tRNA threonylcarbamoyl adenosine modification protein YeaZ